MSRDSRVLISRLIVTAVFISSLLAAVLGSFLITLITVSGGLMVWLLYLLSADLGPIPDTGEAETSLAQSLSKVLAGLGGILAVSALRTYGLDQTMWGGYTFNLMGLALALAIVLITLLPLVILRLIGNPLGDVSALSPPPQPEQTYPPAVQPPPAQPYGYAPYDQEGYVENDEDEEDEDWEEDEAYDEGDEEEAYEDDEEEYEEEDEEEEGDR